MKPSGMGASPDTMRVVETDAVSNRLLLIAGAIAIVLYIIFG